MKGKLRIIVVEFNTWQFLIRCSGPKAQPSFHPVTENVFPAEPTVIVLSHIPGKVAMRIISPSNTMCSYTSSAITRTSWALKTMT